MVTNTHMMDGQRQHYIPGPPPPPPQQQQQANHSHGLPPPPPRPYGLQPGVPPPPPGPHPSTLPPGTVYGFPPGWQQSWGRPGMNTALPPPPPLNQMQNAAYGSMAQRQTPGQLHIPPPPRQYNDKPMLSATFIPGGDSFGPGVGIPPFEDYSFAYMPEFGGTPSSEHAPQLPSADLMNREVRSASASSNRPHLNLALHDASPVSPGPPTATLRNPQPPTSRSEGGTPALGGRQRAQSAAVGISDELGSQWPPERVAAWLSANGFSSEWQETFKTLQISGSDFLELGKGGRGHLGRMYSLIYPQLAKLTQSTNTGWDPIREREEAKKIQKQRDEGKRLRKLIGAVLDSESGSLSAGVGHRRRESVLLPSASTDGGVENSPNLGSAQFATTPSTANDADSPGKQPPPSLHAGGQITRSRSGVHPPLHNKQLSSTSTPIDGRPSEGLNPYNRSDYSRNMLNGLAGRGRHSPAVSGDSSHGLGLRPMDTSPSGSPAPGHAVPAPAASAPNLLSYRGDHSKTNSADGSLKSRASSGNIMSAESSGTGNGRFYENRREGQDLSRNSPLEGPRPYGSIDYAPGPGGKDQSKSFLSKFMRGRKHDTNYPSPDEQALESPTSPATFRQIHPFSNRTTNGSDPTLAQRPVSAAAAAGMESDRFGTKARRLARSTRRFIFVTPDHWNYRLIDVTDIDSASSIRSKIVEELGISPSEHIHVFVTEPGMIDHDEPLNDNLLVAAQSAADATGMIKLYVQIGGPTSFAVPATDGQQMTKSSSVGMSTHEPQSNAPEFDTPEALQKAATEWRKQTELKQRAYLEARQQRKDTGQQGSTIRGPTIIDFDSPRLSPYEDKKMESLVPMRKPPTAPSESSTLTKVNSLRAKLGESRSRTSLEALKRISDPILEEHDRGRRKANSHPAVGIGAALANAGKLASAPTTYGGHSRGSDTGALPRPSFTWAKGNLQFKVPDYEQNSGNQLDTSKPQIPALASLRLREPSPISPASEHPSRPTLGRVKSFGADLEFKETNVSFAPSPNPQTQNDSDDDSDDGLFAIPLANKTTAKDNTHDSANKDQRPVLSVDTDQNPRKARAVAFRSPNSSGGGSAGPGRSGDDSAGDQSATLHGSGGGHLSATSPSENTRPESFVSNIWADRPAVENVVDHLDKFFPGVDLDKPYVEEPGDQSTPTTASERNASDGSATLRERIQYEGESPFNFTRQREETDTLGSDESTLKESNKDKVVSFAQRQMTRSGGQGLGRAKSIRQRAQKANEISRAPSVANRYQNNQNGGITRRKSTKMFGANIVTIKPKPGNRVSVLDPIPQEDSATDGIPKRQATFKIIRGQLIGKGTYGRVYLGMNATTGEFLAVKQVEVNHKAAGQDKDRIKEMVSALDQEIDTMQHLEHPNIVQYLGCERKEFSISIYLEYIPGGSIGSCLRKHGKFEESVVRSLTQQTLNGLAYLHRERILHRDLKADNILLDLDGTSKISDFGISKKSENIYGNDVTNSMQGSVFWMAPEVVRSQGQGYSAKVDIWSLGCVVLEMFAGKRPWSRDEAIGAIFKLGKLNQAPPIPDDVQQTASVDGLNFMYDCFQIDPNERPTADVLLQHSSFCVPDPYYNFYDTNLAAKLRTADAAPTGL